MVERLKRPSSRRKEGIRIESLRRALHLMVNMENRIRFASNVALKDIGLAYAPNPSISLNVIKRNTRKGNPQQNTSHTSPLKL
jgi:hypothetical protein